MEWFIALNKFRRYGLGGPERITPTDIAAYALLTGDWPTRWEVSALADLDLAFIDGQATRPARTLN